MTFGRLWEKFLASAYYSDLSPRTQKDYLQHQKKLLAVFGKVPADSIKPEHIRRYMDKRGEQSKTQANHEKSSMSRVYSWGYERGYVKGNPCAGVSKFKAKNRERYVTDKEYQAVLSVAPLPVFIAMEIAYLCAASQKPRTICNRQRIPGSIKRCTSSCFYRNGNCLSVCSEGFRCVIAEMGADWKRRDLYPARENRKKTDKSMESTITGGDRKSKTVTNIRLCNQQSIRQPIYVQRL